MDGWLDFTRLELAALSERLDALAPKLDPDGRLEWSLVRDTSQVWHLRVLGGEGRGRLYRLDGPTNVRLVDEHSVKA
jgi:hypothetical protein